MNHPFARALVALALMALPASALASIKADKTADKTDKSKHGHSHSHTPLAAKEPQAKKAKHHHAHQAKDSQSVPASSTKQAR
jgi:hypothetical protein